MIKASQHDNEESLLRAIDKAKEEGFEDSEITVITKETLQSEKLNNSEIRVKVSSGTFSDKFAKFLIGEDTEGAALSEFKLTDEQIDEYKKAIIDGKILLFTKRDVEAHNEINNNSAYESTKEIKEASSIGKKTEFNS
ncbi:general stress protein [Staphylococcus massiliensis]|uniref:general stress protein n=1 Tax=Staphylococcus massiliensis TaxID=555791 RepID=UPI001EE06F81|nr:general stress protein [Staphylococcus massiliensis]MCG3402036.1 general stress protein [Staphylococcus massiliensis]